MLNEIGTLRARPNGDSLFVGSSSGVFFINTVRRAFSRAAAACAAEHRDAEQENRPLDDLLSPEECLVGAEPRAVIGTHAPHDHEVGRLPNQLVAKELLMTYFQTWHPLLPFLHGPTCLQDLELLYSREAIGAPPQSSPGSNIIFQCIFNVAKLDRPDLDPLGRASITSDGQLMQALSALLLKSDLLTIQTLLAIQLYFISTMSLRAASTVGSFIMRTIFNSGLHRCPYRYATFTANERDMRKRVFWSAYTLDRYISQALGHPLGIQDSDIDVCSPGKSELHRPVYPLYTTEEGTSPEETVLHLPANHPHRHHISPHSASDTPLLHSREDSVSDEDEELQQPPSQGERGLESEPRSSKQHENQFVQAQFVRYSRLVGRMLEMFHKSIHARSVSPQNVLLLKADIDAWGNDLQSPLPYSDIGPGVPATAAKFKGGFNQDVFFEIARQQMRLQVNRPSLSLDPASAEFRRAIQVCIGAARAIIRTLERQANDKESLFWPGLMSALWMGGLVMAFACQLKLYRTSHAISDISAALRVLKVMACRWTMARNCHDVLRMLLDRIQNKDVQHPQSLETNSDRLNYEHPQSRSFISPHMKKRPRDAPAPGSHSEDQQRKRLSTVTSRATRSTSIIFDESGSSARAKRQSAQSQDSEHGQHAGFIGTNVQSTVSPPTMMIDATYPASVDWQPQQHTSDAANASNGYSSAQYSNHHNVQNDMLDGTTYEQFQSSNWDLPSDRIPSFGSTTLHDVFNGATWGSLLELMEPNI